MSSRPFVKASGNNILDISGQLNIKSHDGLTDNSGIRFYGSKRWIGSENPDYTDNYIGITADAGNENIMYHLPYNDKGNTINDISDSHVIATQGYVRENAVKPVNNREQTFFGIMTEQPEKFTFNGSSNSGNVTIKWHYDDIIPNSDFPCNLLLAAKKSTFKDKQLPYIDKIYIDISGSVDNVPSGQSGSTSSGDSNKWLRHNIMIIGDDGYNQVANQDADKTFTFNKTSLSSIYQTSILNIFGKDTSANSFDVRIYGENFADKENSNCSFPDASDNSTFNNEYSRALIISGLFFPGAKPPSKPQRDSELVTHNSINLSFYVSKTEDGVSNSNASIVKSKAEYVGIETLSSILYPISTSTLNTFDQIYNPSIEGQGISNPFNINLDTGIKSGSKYKYKVAAMNDLINEYSEFSEDISSNFTELPPPNALLTTLDFTYNTPTSVTNKTTLNNTSCVYINVADNQDIVPTDTGNQNFEITKRGTSTDSTKGFGKYVDGSKNLVTITMKIDDVSINEIQYHGFGSTNANDLSFNNLSSSSNEKNYYMIYSQSDIGTDDNAKGFRINGNIQLQTISNSNVRSYIGDPSKNPVILKYEYSRKSAVVDDDAPSSANLSTSTDIYIDDLPLDPIIDGSSTIIKIMESPVDGIQYLMGIPSVRAFSIDITRTYKHINSEYEYIPGDAIIAKIQEIPNTLFDGLGNDYKVELERGDINTSGVYANKNISKDNITYTSTTITQQNSLMRKETMDVEERIYSLRQPDGVLKSVTKVVNHYCDYNSFFVSGTTFTPKIHDIDNNRLVYEIKVVGGDQTKITNLSDLKNIALEKYTNNHKVLIERWTLLYFDDAFRSNGNKSYPDVNNFSYFPIANITDKYNSGSYAYDLSGNQDDSGGYKWIGFKAANDDDNDGTFDKTNPYVKNYTKGTSVAYYFDIYQFLKVVYAFSDNVLAKLFDTNDDVIGFVKQNYKTSYVNNSEITCIGNLSRNFNPQNNWHKFDSNGISLNDVMNGSASIKARQGCLSEPTTTEKGPELEMDLAVSNISIFIGFKNGADVSSDM